MKNESAKSDVKNHLFKHLQTFILLSSSILFITFSFPNDFFDFGIFFFAYFALIPLFLLLYSSSYKKSFLFGFIFAFFWYAISFSWIFAFPLFAGITLLLLIGFSYGILCLILRFALRQNPVMAPILCAAAWVLFEWTKTIGLAAFPFGIIGYTQAFVPTLIGLSRETGVFGISFGIIWLNSVVTFCVLHRFDKKKSHAEIQKPFIKKMALAFSLQFAVLFLAFSADFLLYSTQNKALKTTQINIAAIQRNLDPTKKTYSSYLQAFLVQKRLSESSLLYKVDLIAWPETAFVPSIDFHSRYKIDAEILSLVNSFKELVKNSATAGFLIGNDHGVRTNTQNSYKRLDYNSALYFTNGNPEHFELYNKTLLVPFVEYYPFGDFFPELKKFCLQLNGLFWEQGSELKVFSIKDIQFASPICYEGCFGNFISRFTKKDVDFFVFLVDDAWASHKKEAYQHYAFAILRACEQNKPIIRVSNSGPSAYIEKDGTIIADTIEGVESSFTVNLSVEKNAKKTLYATQTDSFVTLCALFLFTYFIARLLFKIYRTYTLKKNYEKL